MDVDIAVSCVGLRPAAAPEGPPTAHRLPAVRAEETCPPLRQPDPSFLSYLGRQWDAKAFAMAADDSQIAQHFTSILEEWCGTIEQLLNWKAQEGGSAGASGMELRVLV
jgi:hypothetical protein